VRNIFIDPHFGNVFQKHPLTLLDVGASGGISNKWKRAERYLRVVGFEPDKRAFEGLKAKSNASQRFLNTALHDKNDVLKLNLTEGQANSSIFTPNESFLEQFPDKQRFEIVGSVDLNAKRLTQQMLADEGIRDADFLKVDTQGGELFILQGANDLLEDLLFGIEVEVEFVPIYREQPLFSDVDKLLQEKGFQLFDLRRYYWKREVGAGIRMVKGQLIFADALYLKSYEAFLRAISGLNVEQKQAKILKAISICLVYRMYDYALYLCDRAVKDNILEKTEKEIIFKSISKRMTRFSFRGQGRLAKFLYKLHLYLKSDRFYFVDEE